MNPNPRKPIDYQYVRDMGERFAPRPRPGKQFWKGAIIACCCVVPFWAAIVACTVLVFGK
jgi:hypothetical protein